MKAQPEILATRLRESPDDPIALTAASAVIMEGGGGELLHHLLKAATNESTGGLQHFQTSATMSLLERMMVANPTVGGYLMAKLYPLAAAAKDHTTFNAIELWMNEASSRELAGALDNLAKGPERPRMRARYQAWSDAIRRKAQS